MQKKRIVLWILILGWMLVIFLFSTQDGDASGQLSSGFLRRFLLLFLPKDTPQNGELMRTLEFLVRKGAHMTEYGILAVLAFIQLRQYFPGKEENGANPLHRLPFQLPLVLVFVFLYACTDEFHQRFVSGRSGSLRDVLIDSLGGLAGGLLYLLFLKAYQFVRRKS